MLFLYLMNLMKLFVNFTPLCLCGILHLCIYICETSMLPWRGFLVIKWCPILGSGLLIFYFIINYFINFTHQTQFLLPSLLLLLPPHPPTSFHSEKVRYPMAVNKSCHIKLWPIKTLPPRKELQKASSCTSDRSWSHFSQDFYF